MGSGRLGLFRITIAVKSLNLDLESSEINKIGLIEKFGFRY